MKINNSNSNFLQSRFAMQRVQADVGKAKLANAQSFGRQSNKSGDQVELKNGNSASHQLLTARQARQLKADIQGAQTTNAQTLGRQTQDKADVSELKERSSERKAGVAGPKVEASEQEQRPKSAELAQTMMQDFKDTVPHEERVQYFLQAQKWAGGNDIEPYLGSLIQNQMAKKLARMRPELSLKELRKAAKNDPELAKTLKLLDSARNYLRSVRKEEVAVRNEKAAAEQEDHARKIAEIRQKRLTEAHEAMLQISKIYNQMNADSAKAAAEIHQTNLATHQAIVDMMQKSYMNRLASSQQQHAEMIKLITEATSS